MCHDYNTRTKKESVVSSECLQTLEANMINNISSLKDEIICLKDTLIKRLKEENERLYGKCQQLENRVALIESFHDVLRQYSRRNSLGIPGILDSVQDSDLNQQSHQFSQILMLMLNQRKRRTIPELVILIKILRRQSWGLSIGMIARKHYLTGSYWTELIGTFKKNDTVYVKQKETSRSVVILNINVLHDMFPTFMTWAKNVMKIDTNQETKMPLFCHHTKSHQGSSVASVRIWGVCLLDLSHSLRIDCIERLWWDGVFYLIWFSVPTFLIISMQCFSCMETGPLICSLNHWKNVCVIGMTCVVGVPNFSSFSE